MNQLVSIPSWSKSQTEKNQKVQIHKIENERFKLGFPGGPTLSKGTFVVKCLSEKENK